MSLKTDRQLRQNIINEGKKIHSDITAAYQNLLVLADNDINDHLSIQVDLDQEVTLKFAGSEKEITLLDENFVYDDLPHSGAIQVKYSSVQPTSGSIKLRSW